MSTISQRSFSAGEISPRLYARVDTVKYATGARTLRNMIVMRDGGVSNRPGTEFVCEIASSTVPPRLIPFVFNDQQTYVLELGDFLIRLVQSGQLLTDTPAKTITAISQASQAVVTVAGHLYATGDQVYINSNGMLSSPARIFYVADIVDANNFKIKYLGGTTYVDSSAAPAFTSGTASRIYRGITTASASTLSTLKYAQSADQLIVTQSSVPPMQVTRIAANAFQWTAATFGPSIAGPVVTGFTYTVGGLNYSYTVTSIAAETYEESYATYAMGAVNVAAPGAGAPHTVTWNPVTGAQAYNVYVSIGGAAAAFVATTQATTWTNTGVNVDTAVGPPAPRTLFSSSNNYPSCVTYYQQRLCFANTNNATETVWTSKSGQYRNFTISYPLQEDDAVTFTMAGRQVNAVRHLLDLGKLLVFTRGGEWSVEGNGDGALTPTSVNLKQQSYYGASDLQPLVVGNSAVYVQARGSLVRDLAFDFMVDGYRGNDLTVFSSHLVDGYTLVDWAYQQIPHSIIWAVRSDGVLLSLTYIKEQQILGWARHDFAGGYVENVCVVPEGNQDRVYVVVRRTINGRMVRYIERMTANNPQNYGDLLPQSFPTGPTAYVSGTDPVSPVSLFMDSALTYDGRSLRNYTVTLSGGTNWTDGESLTLTFAGISLPSITSSSVGNEVHILGPDGVTIVRFTIQSYVSSTVVTGTVDKTVPVSMRNVALSDSAYAAKTILGLWHLEGQAVSVLGDGNVVASPNNPDYTTVITVTNGQITLPRPYAVVHVGLPFVSDLETLNVDTPNGETLADKQLLVRNVTIHTYNSRGGFVGGALPASSTSLDGLTEFRSRDDSDDGSGAMPYLPEKILQKIEGHWNSNGRIAIRHVDPTPMSILAVHPDVVKG